MPMPSIERVDLLTVPEVTTMLRVHEATVHKLLKEGRLAGFKINRRWRIPRNELDDFVKTAAAKVKAAIAKGASQ